MTHPKIGHVFGVGTVLIPLALFLLKDWDTLWDEAPAFDGSLSQAERAVMLASYQEFDAGAKAQFSSFEELLFRQNPEFVERVDHALADEQCDLLLVTAPAGYGKTGLVTEAIDTHFHVDSSKIEVSEFCDEVGCPRVSDLSLLQMTVNELPTMRDREIRELLSRMGEASGRVIQIDGLDELHTDAIARILASIKRIRSSLHGQEVVLFARPEVVDNLWTDNENEALAGVETASLNPHAIDAETLHLRVRNYVEYRASKWIEGGGDHRDGVVAGVNDDSTIERVTRFVQKRVQEEPYLVDLLRLASLSMLIIEEGLDPEGQSLGGDELSIRRGVLKAVMDRNEHSHGRPGSESRTAYTSALAAIAAHVKPASDGYFYVPELLVGVHPQNTNDSFRFTPREVLQRSGLVSIRPEKGHGRMRFEPIWLQSVLAKESGVLKQVPILWKWCLLALCIAVMGYLLTLAYINVRRTA